MAEKPKRKWIKGAVNPEHKGMEQRAAKAAGESTHEYMEHHEGDKGSAGARARLGLRLEKMHHGGKKKEHKSPSNKDFRRKMYGDKS